jgi:hypothetical protein
LSKGMHANAPIVKELMIVRQFLWTILMPNFMKMWQTA